MDHTDTTTTNPERQIRFTFHPDGTPDVNLGELVGSLDCLVASERLTPGLPPMSDTPRAITITLDAQGEPVITMGMVTPADVQRASHWLRVYGTMIASREIAQAIQANAPIVLPNRAQRRALGRGNA